MKLRRKMQYKIGFMVELADNDDKITILTGHSVSILLCSFAFTAVLIAIMCDMIFIRPGLYPVFAWILIMLILSISIASTLWFAFGVEVIWIRGNDLEKCLHMAGLSVRRVIHGTKIRSLSVARRPFWQTRQQHELGIWTATALTGGGSVKIDYGDDTIRIAAGLNEMQAQQLVDFLLDRLKLSVTDKKLG